MNSSASEDDNTRNVVGNVDIADRGDFSTPPVSDPSANVLALVNLAVRRLDDLRHADSFHQSEMARLRSDYDAQLRAAESQRIDAIRAVDVGAVNRAAEVSATQAQTLAAQVATSAETLRTQVAAAATAQAAALAAALEPIQTAIADLRRAQYEAAGKQGQVVEARASSGAVWGVIAGVGGLILLVIAVAAFAIANGVGAPPTP